MSCNEGLLLLPAEDLDLKEMELMNAASQTAERAADRTLALHTEPAESVWGQVIFLSLNLRI